MGNKKRKIYVSKEMFNEALRIKEKTLTALCEETGLSYNTIRQCINKKKIMEDDLLDLCKALDVSFHYVTDTEGKDKTHISQMSQDFINKHEYITDKRGYIIRSFRQGQLQGFSIMDKELFKQWFFHNRECMTNFIMRGIEEDDIENQFPSFFDDIIWEVQNTIDEYTDNLLKDRSIVLPLY